MRSQGRTLLAVALILAVFAAAGAVFLVRANNDAPPSDAPLGAPSAVSSPSPTPTGGSPTPSPAAPSPTPTAAASPPARFVAVEDNRVAVYRASDGRRERFLTERLTPYREVDPSLSADGKSVLYVHAEGQCAGSIRSVPLTGGPSTVLRKRTAGRVPVQPVQSVRGELAYALTSCTHSRYETGAESVLVVGAREIPFAAQHGATIEDIDWTQDGQRIAVLATMGSPGCPDVSGSDTCRYETRIYVFSPSSAQRVDETRPWRGPAPPAGEECGLSAVSFRPTGRLLAGQTCGDPNAESAGLGRVVELDAASSRVLAERLDIVATVDVDATGRSVVLGMLECAETCEDAPAYAQRLRSDGTVRKIANDRAQPNWA